MTTYFLLKYVHVIGASVLLGTGAGIAFFMLRAHLAGDVAGIAAVSRIVVVADYLFTATAVVLQPVTGIALASIRGYALTDGWVMLSLLLYAFVGAFWLPVVWMQVRMRNLAQQALADNTPLPRQYHRLFWSWFAFGFPAFGGVLAIFWLMIRRPLLEWP